MDEMKPKGLAEVIALVISVLLMCAMGGYLAYEWFIVSQAVTR